MGVKEFWKANKNGFFISGIVITLGCLLLYVVKGSSLIVTVPLGWFGLLFFMFTFGLCFGGFKE